jgi:NADP-dependent aldehyde dehydrogenase
MALTFNSVDPRTGEPGPSFEEAPAEDVAAAVAAAAAVHRSGALRDRGARVALLRGAAARLRAAGDEIVAVCEGETGLPEARLRSELERTCGQLEAFAALVEVGDDAEAIIDHADPDAVPIPKPDLRRMLVPLGPVAVFGASNFPLAFSTAGGDTASALAAGCPVIVKGHPSHPGTGQVVARELRAAVADAGLPEGTFAHLPAAGVEVGEALVDAPEIAAVGFTGSFAGGKALFDRAARRPVPIPVYAEMGSINPIVVTEGALRARAGTIVEGLTASVSNSGGQLCTKPGVVFVPAGADGDAFATDLAARLDGLEPSVMLNERLRDALRAAVDRLAARPEVRPLSSAPAANGPGFRYQPAVYEAPAAAVVEGAGELLEEHFGPVVLLLRHGSREELLAALARIDGQLSGSLHAEPGEDVEDIVAALAERAGRVVFDGFPTGVAVTFGMQHGGPFPATTSPLHTSVGMTAVRRFMRPVAFQNAPAEALPPELREDNPLGIGRRVDSVPSGYTGSRPFNPRRSAMEAEAGQITGTKDKDYNIIWFTEQCLSNTLRLETYIKDAERDGDNELADFFRRAQETSRRGAEQGKELLRSRFAR